MIDPLERRSRHAESPGFAGLRFAGADGAGTPRRRLAEQEAIDPARELRIGLRDHGRAVLAAIALRPEPPR